MAGNHPQYKLLDIWIRLDEGKRNLPYLDPRKIWSVGVGHNMEANPIPLHILQVQTPSATPADCSYPASLVFIRSCAGLTDRQVAMLLAWDLNAVLAWMVKLFPTWDNYPDPVKAALENMGFNLGPGTFAEFDTFQGYMRQGNLVAAADDLAKTEVAVKELPVRYDRIIQAIRTQTWPAEVLALA